MMNIKFFTLGLFLVFGILFTIDFYVLPHKESVFKAKTFIPVLTLYVGLFYGLQYIITRHKSKRKNT